MSFKKTIRERNFFADDAGDCSEGEGILSLVFRQHDVPVDLVHGKSS